MSKEENNVFVKPNPDELARLVRRENDCCEETNILDYIVAIISDFASRFKLTTPQAYRYLDSNNGIDFLLRNYDIEHTLSFDDVVQDVTEFCHNRGGTLA